MARTKEQIELDEKEAEFIKQVKNQKTAGETYAEKRRRLWLEEQVRDKKRIADWHRNRPISLWQECLDRYMREEGLKNAPKIDKALKKYIMDMGHDRWGMVRTPEDHRVMDQILRDEGFEIPTYQEKEMKRLKEHEATIREQKKMKRKELKRRKKEELERELARIKEEEDRAVKGIEANIKLPPTREELAKELEVKQKEYEAALEKVPEVERPNLVPPPENNTVDDLIECPKCGGFFKKAGGVATKHIKACTK